MKFQTNPSPVTPSNKIDVYLLNRSNFIFQQKLTVANAKCKLIDLAKREKSPVKINPTGKCAQQLAQWALDLQLNNRASQKPIDKKEKLTKDFDVL